jgi:8-oxo-dGTP pyrophosphatase MutT (NUDIX family)
LVLFFYDWTVEVIKEVQEAAYIIPFRIDNGKKEIALLKYKDGYGAVGGRSEGSEAPREALRREIGEELGEAAAFLADASTMVEEPREVENSWENINIRGAKRERHFLFVVKIPKETKLVFREKRKDKVDVVWLPLSSLTDENIIVYPDLRAYHAKHALPMLDSL